MLVFSLITVLELFRQQVPRNFSSFEQEPIKVLPRFGRVNISVAAAQANTLA
jgi:hypothetical protein